MENLTMEKIRQARQVLGFVLDRAQAEIAKATPGTSFPMASIETLQAMLAADLVLAREAAALRREEGANCG